MNSHSGPHKPSACCYGLMRKRIRPDIPDRHSNPSHTFLSRRERMTASMRDARIRCGSTDEVCVLHGDFLFDALLPSDDLAIRRFSCPCQCRKRPAMGAYCPRGFAGYMTWTRTNSVHFSAFVPPCHETTSFEPCRAPRSGMNSSRRGIRVEDDAGDCEAARSAGSPTWFTAANSYLPFCMERTQ